MERCRRTECEASTSWDVKSDTNDIMCTIKYNGLALGVYLQSTDGCVAAGGVGCGVGGSVGLWASASLLNER